MGTLVLALPPITLEKFAIATLMQFSSVMGKAVPQPIGRPPSKHGWLLHTLLIHDDLIHVNRIAISSRGLNPIKNKCAEQKEDETNEEQQNHHPLLIR